MRAVPKGQSGRSEIGGPLARAALVGLAGAAGLVLVGGVLASTAGLLFVSGATGAGIGLALSRAALPSSSGELDGAAVPRGAVVRLSVLVACLAVLAGVVGTWLVAIAEGGTLGLIDYLWTAFGPFVPTELMVASLAAAWGARVGPVTGR